MSKYYAVKIGVNVGIYDSWIECQKQVRGFPKACFKSFATKPEAKKYMESITNENEANTFIAPWPGYAGKIPCTIKSNNTINCNGIIINTITKDVDIQGKKPNNIVFLEDNVFNVKTFENGMGTGLILQYDPLAINYVLTVCSPEIANSMFTRLYYFDGIGLMNFEKFTQEVDPLSGRPIIVWKVKW